MYYLDWKSSFAPILAMFRFRTFFENWNFDPLKNNQKLLIKNFLLCFLSRWIYISSRFFYKKNFLYLKISFDYFQAFKNTLEKKRNLKEEKRTWYRSKKASKKFYENFLIIFEEVKFSIFKENSKPKYIAKIGAKFNFQSN